MSAPDATIRDSDWKPMSYIAPSPPMTHSRRSGWPAWSQRARMPSAIGRRVLEQRVRPRHEVRVERVGAAEDGVAAGRGDDAHRLGAVDLARRGDEHPDRGRLAAAGARAGAADVADGVLAEHEVGQRLLVAVLGRRRRQRAEERHVARVALERGLAGRPARRVDLVDHDERVVAERGADLDALAAALAVAGVDEDPERAGSWPRFAGTSAYFCVCGEVAASARPPQRPGPAAAGERPRAPASSDSGRATREDRRVGAGVDAGHAADALLGDEVRDARREAAEVAGRGGAGRDDAAGQAGVGRQLASAAPRR